MAGGRKKRKCALNRNMTHVTEGSGMPMVTRKRCRNENEKKSVM
jgi:hypothetical protein